MATKDQRYDPPVNYDQSDNYELNNEKVSPGTSPSDRDLGDVFVYNNLRRGGGPQSENGASARKEKKPSGAGASSGKKKKEKKTKPQKCKACKADVKEYWDGYRYSCFDDNQDDQEYQDTHKFCKECADEKPACPAQYQGGTCSGTPVPGRKARKIG